MDPNPIRVTTPSGTTSRPDGGEPVPYDVRWGQQVQQQQQQQVQHPQQPQQQQQRVPSVTSLPPPGVVGTPQHQHQQLPPQQQLQQQQQQLQPQQPVPIQQPQQQPLPHEQQRQQYGGYLEQPSPQPQHQTPSQQPFNSGGAMSELHAAANGGRPPIMSEQQRRQGGPVEFNHAINYVNKIKNRFATQPEIYKNFLEILQTYQREQLRIAEVYSQVTLLFKDAPDLLEDFKQFLPDTTQPQQRPGDPGAVDAMRLPPVGNFAPPGVTGMSGSAGSIGGGTVPGSVQREGKKKKGGSSSSHAAAEQGKANNYRQLAMQPGHQQQPGYNIDSNNGVPVSSMRGGPSAAGSGSGRKGRPVTQREPASPTLVPAIPEPLPPPSRSGGLHDEIAFFDKVKKVIGNKQTYNEFLKVINLFTQKIIDKNLLVERVDGFIGSSKELMDWFKRFVKYEGKPLHIENIVHKKHNLELSLCRSYGPSYRLLPKTETLMPCSGRDEMCWEVLNDEWVVHPTWASEDSGFVAHRKNQYEEILYRVEEERHEYDYYIGSNLRTIQTLETIANRIANLTNEEKAMFKLQPKLGTDSTIYQKIIKKIYDKEKGLEVIEALHENPAVAVPIVLRRLKQKDEEWKRAHREWNKVWRETEQKVFYKSLDHIGLTFKQTDKKLLTTRSLVSEITTVKAEQNSKRKNPALPLPKSQLLFKMSDNEVILDILRLVLCFLEHGGSYSANDRERMETFFRSFLELFFSLPPNLISEKFPDEGTNAKSSSPEGGDAEENGTAEITSSSNATAGGGSSTSSVPSSPPSSSASRKRPRETSGDLLRDVLKKSRFNGASSNGRPDISPSETPEPETETESNTPEVILPDAFSAADSLLTSDIRFSEDAWLKHAETSPSPELSIKKETQNREVFNLFSNTTIYVFVRTLQILYGRLKEVKGYEDIVSKEIANGFNVDFANDLGLYDTKLADLGLRFDSNDCYGQLLSLSEKLIEGDVEHQWFEEAIRQAYRNRAYKFYTIDKIVQALVKHVHTIVADQRSSDVLVLFQADRSESQSDIKKQIAYRMQVKKIIGPEESLFRIDWNNEEKQIGFQFLGNYDLTMRDIKKAEDKWNYYLTSYMMSVPTEGVPLDKIKAPLLYRSMFEPVEENYPFVIIEQGLMARVCMNTYKLFFEAGTVDFFTRPSAVDWQSLRTPALIEAREKRWNAILEGTDEGWKTGLDEKEISNTEERFKIWKEQGPDAFKKWTPLVEDNIEPVEKKGEAEGEKVTESASTVEKIDETIQATTTVSSSGGGDETVTEAETITETVTPKPSNGEPSVSEKVSSSTDAAVVAPTQADEAVSESRRPAVADAMEIEPSTNSDAGKSTEPGTLNSEIDAIEKNGDDLKPAESEVIAIGGEKSLQPEENAELIEPTNSENSIAQAAEGPITKTAIPALETPPSATKENGASVQSIEDRPTPVIDGEVETAQTTTENKPAEEESIVKAVHKAIEVDGEQTEKATANVSSSDMSEPKREEVVNSTSAAKPASDSESQEHEKNDEQSVDEPSKKTADQDGDIEMGN